MEKKIYWNFFFKCKSVLCLIIDWYDFRVARKKFPDFSLTFPGVPTQIPVTVAIYPVVIFCNIFQCPRNTLDSRTLAGVPHQCPTVGLKTPVPMSDRISRHSSTILLILTSENTAPLTMKDQYIPIKWGYFTREHCCDKLRGGRHFVTTAHLHCAGSSSRLWAMLLITGLCSPAPPQDKNSFPLSNMVVFVSYFIKFDSWVHVAYCGRHFTNIVS